MDDDVDDLLCSAPSHLPSQVTIAVKDRGTRARDAQALLTSIGIGTGIGIASLAHAADDHKDEMQPSSPPCPNSTPGFMAESEPSSSVSTSEGRAVRRRRRRPSSSDDASTHDQAATMMRTRRRDDGDGSDENQTQTARAFEKVAPVGQDSKSGAALPGPNECSPASARRTTINTPVVGVSSSRSTKDVTPREVAPDNSILVVRSGELDQPQPPRPILPSQNARCASNAPSPSMLMGKAEKSTPSTSGSSSSSSSSKAQPNPTLRARASGSQSRSHSGRTATSPSEPPKPPPSGSKTDVWKRGPLREISLREAHGIATAAAERGGERTSQTPSDVPLRRIVSQGAMSSLGPSDGVDTASSASAHRFLPAPRRSDPGVRRSGKGLALLLGGTLSGGGAGQRERGRGRGDQDGEAGVEKERGGIGKSNDKDEPMRTRVKDAASLDGTVR